ASLAAKHSSCWLLTDTSRASRAPLRRQNKSSKFARFSAKDIPLQTLTKKFMNRFMNSRQRGQVVGLSEAKDLIGAPASTPAVRARQRRASSMTTKMRPSPGKRRIWSLMAKAGLRHVPPAIPLPLQTGSPTIGAIQQEDAHEGRYGDEHAV